MTTSSSVVVDSNVFIAYFLENDSLHTQAVKLFDQLENIPKHLNQLLLAEITTVILQRSKLLPLATTAYDIITSDITKDVISHLSDQQFENKTYQEFINQNSNKLSVADCSLVALAKHHQIKTIVSFDRDLRKEFKNQFTFLPKRINPSAL